MEQLRAARGLGTAAKAGTDSARDGRASKVDLMVQEGRLVVAVTKMEEVSWAEEFGVPVAVFQHVLALQVWCHWEDRFDEVISTLTPVLTNAGYTG